MASKPVIAVEAGQRETASRKARRRARKSSAKAAAQRNIQSESVIQPESVISSDEKSDDMEGMEMRIKEKVTNAIAEQRAYWDMSVERRQAINPNYIEITHRLTDDPIIDRLMDYWED